MSSVKFCLMILCLLVSLIIDSSEAFDDDNNNDHVEEHHIHTSTSHSQAPLPKDKILLKDVKTLLFYRNKRTTSRRTHSIHQLSCVGGTAGCRLFTPDIVECTNTGFNADKSNFNWKCKADISERVRFNHVEVICEGYDYPEDDYILMGSCGLEFTLDYVDPHDAHKNSYFHHADEHEKAMHHERVKATAKPKSSASSYLGYQFLEQLIHRITDHMFLIGMFSLFVLFSILLVRFFSFNKDTSLSSSKKRASTYGPLTSAVLTTKKAC